MKTLLYSLLKKFNFLNGIDSTLNRYLLLTVLLISLPDKEAISQNIIPTKGKEFWIGFTYQPQFSNSIGTKRFEVFITSTQNTSGTISIPQQAWSQTFTVTANVTTTITLPLAIVEHIGSCILDNKGILIETQDTVSVFAISFQKYTADASVVYPIESLGTEYRISSYRGLSGTSPGNLFSNFVIVATKDSTQIEITPSANLLNGGASGVPFIIHLDEGESYQVMASNFNGDLTGTKIVGTDSSGSCRPFAVFSGSACVNIPAGCGYCDIIYDQALPVPNWGTTYYSTPFSFATKYTIRILADQNNTSVVINGAAPIILNAGQFFEQNGLTTAMCIQGDKRISVIQYMQGMSCATNGDPSMMYLNAEEQKIDEVTFSTITSTIITQHNLNVVMKTSHTSQLLLDGIPVSSSLFTAIPSCNTISYVQLPLTQGSHTLSADSGFTAYVYGTGAAESYAYSVGSFSKSAPIPIDSILCTSDTINLSSGSTLFGSWWSTLTNPNDTIANGSLLVLTPPIIPDVYIQHGNEYISGCEKNYYINVETPDPPVIFASVLQDTTCFGQQLQLNSGVIPASSNFNYAWTPTTGLNNPNISNPVLTASTSGWYKVAVSSINGCANTVYDSIYITVLNIPLPTFSAGNNQTICMGDSVNLQVPAGYTYFWQPGGMTTNSVFVSPTVNTGYIISITDTNGCGNSDTVQISVNSLPVANAGSDVQICSGNSYSITASGGTTYLWNTGQSTATITGTTLIDTTLTVSVTNANGCSDTDDITVFVNPLPIVTLGQDIQTCFSASPIQLVAAGAASYSWNSSSSTNDTILVSPQNTTTYIVVGTDTAGCINRDTLNVIVHPLPPVTAGTNKTICEGDSILLLAAGASSFLWQPVNSTSNPIVTAPVTTTSYIVEGTDTNNCVNSDTVVVTVIPTPPLPLSSDISICAGSSAQIQAITGNFSYIWSTGATTSSITVTPSSNTSYSVTIIDNNFCTNSDSLIVFVNALPVANAGADTTICSSWQTTLLGTGGINYVWTPGNVFSSAYTVTPQVTTSYIVNVTDINGCTNQDTVTVFIDPLLSGNSTSVPLCYGSSTILSDSGGGSYQWTPGGSTNDSISINPLSTSTYYCDIITPVGCQIKDTIYVNVLPLPIADAGISQEICFGESIQLTASGGTSYYWTANGATTAAITVSPAATANYTAIVSDNNGCTSSDSVDVIVHALPLAAAGNDQTICEGSTAGLTASGGVSYIWNPGGQTSASILVSPAVTSTYIVQVTDQYTCINSDTVIININPSPIAEYDLTLPACVSYPIQFNNLSSSSATMFRWKFGDGNFSTQLSPSHTYLISDKYPVQLYCENIIGCADSVEKLISINPNPVASFTTQDTCAESVVSFSSTSQTSSGSLVSWYWDFGDGNQSTQENPINIYAAHGVFDVTLSVQNDSGCFHSITIPQSIEIYPLPIAAFSAAPPVVSILNPKVYFLDQSFGSQQWIWDFGDHEGTSLEQNPYYFYNDTGKFIASVICISQNGCRDTAYGEVYVTPDFQLFIPNAFTPNGDEKNDAFQAYGIGIGEFRMVILDRWGKEVFTTNQPEGAWNGRAENTGHECPEGIYVYKVILKDYKNEYFEKTGQLTLIR